MKEVVRINNKEEWDYVVSKSIFKEFYLPIHRYSSSNNYINLYEFGYNDTFNLYERLGYTEISFEEFKSRYELKIGDTFKCNGFVCEVKEEIKNWHKIEDNKNNKIAFEKLCKQDVLDIEKLHYAKLTKITNKEFIKQLEENAR